ncbi:MAG: hypothetical protein R3284_11185 [Rubricoccaceae bacterium]|nr:hypothetical protein [Rubricoccaceae bacterium]
MELLQFACTNCGADLEFAPGTESLKCPYCGTENRVAPSEPAPGELDFNEAVAALEGQVDAEEVITAKCQNCAAETVLPPNVTSDTCAFCGSPVVLEGASMRSIKPQSLLPFKVKESEAQVAFKKWLSGRWFAPNALKTHSGTARGLQGMYIPHWTYDAHTATSYTGQRGVYYYTTQTYTVNVNGRPQTRTRQVRHTRWYPAFGRVYVDFDDVLVEGTTSLPEIHRPRIGQEGLSRLVPYANEYLAGFRTEHYTVGLKEGFEAATHIMAPRIDQAIRNDIGGNEQRILQKDTRYFDVTYKHILLPIWISSYQFKNKTYRFTVDAETGEVQGERPYSAIKIAMTVLTVILIILTIVMLSQGG